MPFKHERVQAVREMRGKMWSPGPPSTARREDRVGHDVADLDRSRPHSLMGTPTGLCRASIVASWVCE